MKKICIVLLLCLAGIGAFAQNIFLDEAIQSMAAEMGQRLPQGSKVAVVSFTTPADRLSSYVINELNNAIVNVGKLTVVDRQQLDLIMQEVRFQESGLVSDESAQEIGRILGAQYIVSGSMELIAGSWRFRTWALTVENAAIVYSGSRNVVNNRIIASLAGEDSEKLVSDFTAAERNRARWLNVLWGAGSFSQRDILGGSVTAALGVGGLVCLIIGLSSTIDGESLANNSDSQISGVPPYRYNGKTYSSYDDAYSALEADAQKKRDTGGIFMVAGGVMGVAGIVFGFIRPSFAHRPGYLAGTFVDPARWNLALVADHRGDSAFRLSYTMSY
jgi:TolB-like protein